MRKAIQHLRIKSTKRDGDAGPSNDFPQGILAFADPERAVVDIVFIHGFTGDRQRTWTHPDTQAAWPQTILPPLLPTARILTYGYDAYVLRPQHYVSLNRLRDHAKDLLNTFTTYRADSSSLGRPVIFVAHSLGGLLCKDMLLLSRDHPDKHLCNVFEHTVAIAFMGTPHTGSVLANWARIPASSLGAVTSINTSLLSVLHTRSEVLSRIQEDFLSMLRRLGQAGRHLQVTCFYETLPMPIVGQIVPEESARLPGYNSIPLHANHRDLVRYKAATDHGFKNLLGELSRWVAQPQNSTTDLQSLVLVNQSKPIDKAECLKSLAFPEMDVRQRNIDRPNDATCTWIFEDPSYMVWEDTEDATSIGKLLWIKGKPGSGKSTLMKSLVSARVESLGQTADTLCLSFFFNARGADIEKSPMGLYRTLLYQLLDQSDPMLRAFYPYFRRKGMGVGGTAEWQLSELSEFFHEIISKPQARMVEILVDALDECNDYEVRVIVENFEKSVIAARNRGGSLRICWSSRHYPHISNSLGFEIRMEDKNASDIQRYIDQELRLPPGYDIAPIKQALLQKASGVFLWIVLVVRRLRKAADQGHEQREIMKLLRRIPDRLEDYFADIVESMNSSDWDRSLKLLRLVLCSLRPMNIAEVCLALEMGTEPVPRMLCQVPGVLKELTQQDCQRISRRITDLSGGLCEVASGVSDTSGTYNFYETARLQTLPLVQVIHETVRDFLLGEKGLRRIGLSASSNSLASSHAQLARICSNWLGLSEVRESLLGPAKASKIDGIVRCLSRSFTFPQAFLQHTLTTYSFEYMSEHMRMSVDPSFAAEGAINPYETPTSRRSALEGWLLLYAHSVCSRRGVPLRSAEETLRFISRNAWTFQVSPTDLSELTSCINKLTFCFLDMCPAYQTSATQVEHRSVGVPNRTAKLSSSTMGTTFYQICWTMGFPQAEDCPSNILDQRVQLRKDLEHIMEQKVRLVRRIEATVERQFQTAHLHHLFTFSFVLEMNSRTLRDLSMLRSKRNLGEGGEDALFRRWSRDLRITDFVILTDIETLWSRIAPTSEMDDFFFRSFSDLQSRRNQRYISLILAENSPPTNAYAEQLPAFEAIFWKYGIIPDARWRSWWHEPTSDISSTESLHLE